MIIPVRRNGRRGIVYLKRKVAYASVCAEFPVIAAYHIIAKIGRDLGENIVISGITAC